MRSRLWSVGLALAALLGLSVALEALGSMQAAARPGQPAEKKAAVDSGGKKERPGKSVKKGKDADDADADPNEAEFDKLKAQYEEEKTKEAFERVETIAKFGDFPTTRTVPFLEGILKDLKEEKGQPQVKAQAPIAAAAVRALGKLGSREAVAAIVVLGVPRLVGDVNITYLSQALANQLENDAEEWLVKNGLTEAVRKDREAMKIMIDAISKLRTENRIPLLQAELKKAATPEVRIAILHSFRDSLPKDAAKFVHPFLKDPDEGVMVAVLQVLEAAEAKTYAHEYMALLKSKSWQVRAMGVDLLAMCEHKEIVKLIEPLLEDPEARVRIGVVRVLAAAGGDPVMPILIKALEKNEGRVLDDITDALARLTGQNFGSTSVQWESWWAANKGKATIARIGPQEFEKLKEGDGGQKSQVYFGLRVISKNLAFIIDTSGSMIEGYELPGERKPEDPPPATPAKTEPRPAKGSKAAAKVQPKKDLTAKIDVAKKELLKVLEGLPTGVKVNIIRFNSLVEAWKPAITPLDPGSRREAVTFVKNSQPEGQTNVYGALEEAFKDPKLDTIYFLSDGAPTLGTYIETKEILEQVEKLNQLRKVKINTIGFNLNAEERQLMEQLADMNYGVFLSR